MASTFNPAQLAEAAAAVGGAYLALSGRFPTPVRIGGAIGAAVVVWRLWPRQAGNIGVTFPALGIFDSPFGGAVNEADYAALVAELEAERAGR